MGATFLFFIIHLFYIVWREGQGRYELLMMVGAGGTRTCVHPHVSRPLYHCATDADFINIARKSGRGLVSSIGATWATCMGGGATKLYSPCQLSWCAVISGWQQSFSSPCQLFCCAIISGWQQSFYSPCHL